MWMKNTLLPLSVAFIDEQGKILNIEDMQPQTLNFALRDGAGHLCVGNEQAGWFAQKNIKPGTTIAGLPKTK